MEVGYGNETWTKVFGAWFGHRLKSFWTFPHKYVSDVHFSIVEDHFSSTCLSRTKHVNKPGHEEERIAHGMVTTTTLYTRSVPQVNYLFACC